MDSVRQWWFDAAWPVLQKARWFVAVWIGLALIAIPWGLRAQERGLEDASRTVLGDAGIVVEDVTFTGRNGVITGSLTTAERSRAEAVLSDVDGVRKVEWLVTTPAPVPVATTTTTSPPGSDLEQPTLSIKLNFGRVVLRGVLPDARTIAAVGSMAERLYAPQVVNKLVVGDVAEADWVPSAADLIAILPIVSGADVTLDGSGVSVIAVTPTAAAEASLRAGVKRALDPDVPVTFDISVAEGGLPMVDIEASGDGSVVFSGAVPRRILADDIVAAVTAAADGGELVGELTIDKSLVTTYVVHRLSAMVTHLALTGRWSLRYEGSVVTGAVLGEGLFRGFDSEPTVRLERVLDDLAAVLVGDPDLTIAFDVVVVAAAENTDADLATRGDVARQRADSVFNLLMRAGVDPERITTTVGLGDGEVLRFRVQSSDR